MSKENYNPGKITKAAEARAMRNLEDIVDGGIDVPKMVFTSVRRDFSWLAERLDPTEQMIVEMREMASTGKCKGVKITDEVHDWAAEWSAELKFERKG